MTSLPVAGSGAWIWSLRLDRLRRLVRPLVDEIAAAAPHLSGAACDGAAPLHDWWLPGETLGARTRRHARARRLCADCPVLDACAAAAASLPPEQRSGVWAGVAYPGPRPDPPSGRDIFHRRRKLIRLVPESRRETGREWAPANRSSWAGSPRR